MQMIQNVMISSISSICITKVVKGCKGDENAGGLMMSESTILLLASSFFVKIFSNTSSICILLCSFVFVVNLASTRTFQRVPIVPLAVLNMIFYTF